MSISNYCEYIESYIEDRTEKTESAGDYYGQFGYVDRGFDFERSRYSQFYEDNATDGQ